MTAEILSPRCPGCDDPPILVVGGDQAFCGRLDCRVFTWNMYENPARFKAQAKVIDPRSSPEQP